eukprot:TRINITY_DN12191_c0_g1_i2.p1 TRINITY_DN12191_c0_g1~~TRINITY_DN12191_c0_g1_i2.p1  ORF type:complete len:551 (+),score=162.82 TRINITY_DN12191_c0_g1_i2:43-1695(+)
MEEMESNLIVYLNAEWPVGKYREDLDVEDETGTRKEKMEDQSWNNLIFKNKIFSTFGVNVWIEGDFYSFKYEACTVIDWIPAVNECRGFIAYRSPKCWEVASRPFDKFFNQNEPECPFNKYNTFDPEQFYLSEKADGSCIQFWYCSPEIIEENTRKWVEYKKIREEEEKEIINKVKQQQENQPQIEQDAPPEPNIPKQKKWESTLTQTEKRGKFYERLKIREVVRKKVFQNAQFRPPVHKEGWRISTLGKITPNPKFEDLFFRFFGDGLEFSKVFDPEMTYIFELCCKDNKVVTEYQEDKLFLIGIRSKKDGSCLSIPQTDQFVQKLKDLNCRVVRPVVVKLGTIGIKTLKEIEDWIEQESKKDIYGSHPEGFVLLKDAVPVAKMKNSSYHSIHQILTGPLFFVRNTAIDHHFKGTIDDIYGLLPPPIQRFTGDLKKKTEVLLEEVRKLAQKLLKEFMSKVQEKTKGWERIYADIVKKEAKISLEGKSYFLVGFFFQFKETLVWSQEREIGELFLSSYLKDNYLTFSDYWKATDIPELLEELKLQQKIII